MATLTQLEYLVMLDQTRHFGRAAELSHVTQPTLSAQLHKLEEEIGVVLFDRDKQPILPTEQGKPLIEQARLVLAEYRRFALLAKEKLDSLEGEFTLGVIPTVAPYVIPELLRRFDETYPGVKLTVEEMSTRQIIDALDRDAVDAGVAATPLGLTRIEERPLYYETFRLFVNPGHEYAGLAKVTLDRVRREDLWLPSEEHCLREQAVSLCQGKGQRGRFRSLRLKGGSLETLVELVENGEGYTLLPQLAADLTRKRKFSGRVVEFARPEPAREISVVHRRGHLKQGILKALIGTLETALPRTLARRKTKDIRVIGLEGIF